MKCMLNCNTKCIKNFSFAVVRQIEELTNDKNAYET